MSTHKEQMDAEKPLREALRERADGDKDGAAVRQASDRFVAGEEEALRRLLMPGKAARCEPRPHGAAPVKKSQQTEMIFARDSQIVDLKAELQQAQARIAVLERVAEAAREYVSWCIAVNSAYPTAMGDSLAALDAAVAKEPQDAS